MLAYPERKARLQELASSASSLRRNPAEIRPFQLSTETHTVFDMQEDLGY